MKQRIYITLLFLFLSHPFWNKLNAASLWIESESFEEKGGWVLDQQFMDLMGSPYLMAHGLGKPVADAFTDIEVSEEGPYKVYVRTFNWTSPWTDKEGPGKFKILVDNKQLSKPVGCTGNQWEWQHAGQVNLKKGTHRIALHDLTGFNGRCDAIYLTTDEVMNIPHDGEDLASLRKNFHNPEGLVPDTINFDFVVVGGGIAGMCAAVTAARNGLNVALVNDRPVLGGNNSAEVRVHLGGHIELGPNEGLGRMIREFGHSRKGNAMPAEYYEDEKKDNFIAAEPNITLFPCYRATEVSMDGKKISSVTIHHISDNSEIILSSPLFSDCTGDGTIGYLAGAEYAMGRESRDVYNEPLAPIEGDSLTMGSSIQWYSKDQNKKCSFPEFNYGVDFNEDNCERVDMGEWTWETGMNRNQIDEAERIRDYGLMVIFSNWSFLKNHLKDNDRFSKKDLEWVGYISGKRESRRLLGDYILKQDDIDKNVHHEDASFTASWSLDLHFPDPKNSEKFKDNEFKAATNHIFIYPYAVPYRCLYSRNVDNLFMAGRNISVSHVALGTVRVMRTTGMMGEVVGMAASLCHKNSSTPRGVYQNYLADLKVMMKEGAGKPSETLPDNQNFNLANKLLPTPRMLKE